MKEQYLQRGKCYNAGVERILATKAKRRWFVITDGSNISDRGIREGALQYVREHRITGYSLGSEETVAGIMADRDLRRRVDFAFVCHVFDEKLIRRIARSECPFVCLRGDAPERTAKEVGSRGVICSIDNVAIGKMAADHFLAQPAYASYVYISGEDSEHWNWWADERRDAYFARIREKGAGVVSEYRLKPSVCNPLRDVGDLTAWLDKLPRPIAVFACNDQIALKFCTQVALTSYAIPEDIAVLGVDDDKTVCEGFPGGISSIRVNYAKLGYEAMMIVEECFAGETSDERIVLCLPDHVVARGTTKVTAPDDRFVYKALRFIEENSFSPIEVEDVMKACGVSHSYLSRRFRQYTGKTVIEAIHEKRLLNVRNLLVGSDSTLSQISAECGFKTPAALCALFKRTFGMTMKDYRIKYGTFSRKTVR